MENDKFIMKVRNIESIRCNVLKEKMIMRMI